ncbi:hypothetical protein Tco_0199701 [Tanacetum coccineum]
MDEQDIPPPTITAMKIPVIRKGEYDIWSMRMRQYIYHTDHNLWDVIVNGDLEEEPAPTTGETFAPPAPKTAKQLAARRNQERVKSILLLAIPDEYLLKFHNVTNAKSLWESIKSRFGGNVESKKMQKNVLKHQFEKFSTASNESLDKAYDRFQKLISHLEVHGAPISKEDINQKFLRSLPSSWNQIALIMINKPDIDEIDIDDLYNNLRVYEDELKRSSGSNSASQNLAFLSSKNTGSTNKVSTASEDFGIWEGVNEEDLMEDNWHGEGKKKKKRKGGKKEKTGKRRRGRKQCNQQMISITAFDVRITSSSSSSSSDSENYELKCREIKINNLNLELEKAVKERDELKDKIAKWEESTKNLEEILKSQMIARVKTGVLIRTGFVSTARPSVSTTRPVSTARPSFSTARPVSTVRPSINTARPISTASPNISIARPGYASRPIYPIMDNLRPIGSCSPAVVNTSKGKLNTDLKKSRWVGGLRRIPGSFVQTVIIKLKKGNLEICYRTLQGGKCLLYHRLGKDSGKVIKKKDTEGENMKEKSTDFVTPTKASGEAQEEDISPTILEAAKTLSKVASQGVSKVKSTDKEVSTGSAKVDSGTASKRVKGRKAPMVEKISRLLKKTKEQIRQEAAGLEEAIRLQAQMDEEVAKQIHLDKMLAKRVQEEQELSKQQLKRKAKVQKVVSFYTIEDWDTIRAKLEANTELEQETLKKQKIDIQDASTTKGKYEVVKEEETEVPVKKTGMRRKQKARKGINIDKSAQDEVHQGEAEAY